MPTAKNRFQILNLHAKIHRKTKKKIFLMNIYPNFTFNVNNDYGKSI